jgi:hypothetical protein
MVKHMICPEIHDNRVVLWGSCTTICLVCEKEILNLHIPGNMVCPDCSNQTGMCEICGAIVEPLGDQNE